MGGEKPGRMVMLNDDAVEVEVEEVYYYCKP